MSLYTVDKNKRGKLVFVSLLVTFAVILTKLVQQSEVVNIYDVLFTASLVSFLSYVGLLWALSFQTTIRAMMYVIAQSSLIVFVLTVFLEIFVFRRVGRVYEVIILLAVSSVMFFITYGSYLMANIFNVAHFKEIPLIQVAKTTSFLLTLLSVYFITFSFLEIGLQSYVTIILLAILYFLILLFHYRHLGISRDIFWKNFLLAYFFTLLASSLYFLIGGNALIFSIVPCVTTYCLINLTSLENLSNTRRIEFYLITFVSFLLVIFSVI